MRIKQHRLSSISLLVLGALLSLNTVADTTTQHTPNYMPEKGSPFYHNIFATGESVSNLAGGLKTGTQYNGMTFTKFAMNGSVIGLPKGGRFRISALAAASQQPSANLIGDFQVASNIEANPDLLLYDVWYRQNFSSQPLQLRFGLIDMNEYFNVTESASYLLNSSFGVDAAISGNSPLSIYPKPGLGVIARNRHAPSKFLLGIFSGNPDDRSAPFRSGRFAIGEWQQTAWSTSYFKLGAWQCDCTSDPGTEPKTGTYGLYGSFEYRIGYNATNQNTLFLRLASSHGTTTVVPKSYALGISSPGLFTTRPDDVFSAGITQAKFNDRPAETSYELTYVWQVHPNFAIQPDYQFIHRPNGTLPNAQVLIFRFMLSYENHFTRVKR